MTSLHDLLPLLALAGVLTFVVAFVGAALYLRPRRRSQPIQRKD